MRRLDSPGAPALTVGACLLVLTLCVGGCNRITLLRPDASRGDFERTARDVVISDRSARPDVQGQLAMAQQNLSAADLAGAEQAARAALKIDSKSAVAHALLALIAERRGDQRQAGEFYQRAIVLAPEHGAMHNNYGAWLCRNGRAAESLASFERALADQAYATPAAAMANLGACAASAGDPVRAQAVLMRALAIDPSSPVALGALAELELLAGNAFRARAFSERRLAVDPIDAQALRIASQIEDKLGDRRSAESYVRRLRKEFPQEPVEAGDNGGR